MRGMRGELLDGRDVGRKRQRGMRQAIDQPEDDQREQDGADRLMQIIEGLLQRPAPLVRDDDAEQEP